MAAINKSCSVVQGFSFQQTTHKTCGYINTLTIGDHDVAPDFRVLGPWGQRQAVAVLERVEWSKQPRENIMIAARVSPANAQVLTTLAAQGVKNAAVKLSFAVYQYDPLAKVYFPAFKSAFGVAPEGVVGGSGWSAPPDEPPIYALVGKTGSGEAGFKVGASPELDASGVECVVLDLVLAPPLAGQAQQLASQTADKTKQLLVWGLG